MELLPEKYETKVLDDRDLNLIPDFNKSLSGFPYLERTAGDIDIKQSFPILEDADTFEVTMIDGPPVFMGPPDYVFGSYTYRHGLGKIPIVIATLITQDDSKSYFQLPYTGNEGDGATLDITELTTESITIGIYFGYFSNPGSVKGNIYFLRPTE